jgi:charged multivesicular body protein 7
MSILEDALKHVAQGSFHSTMSSPTPSSSSLTLSALLTYSSTSNSRLQSLYSDISRQKHSNPTSYHSNVEWWQRTLEALVTKGWLAQSTISARSSTGAGKGELLERETDKLILSAGRGLVESLRYDGVGRPLGLGAVIVSPVSLPFGIEHD